MNNTNQLEVYYLSLARKIYRLRRSKGFSQKAFAKHIGISASYLAKIECGLAMAGLSMELLYLIASGLALSLGQLMSCSTEDYSQAYSYSSKKLQKGIMEEGLLQQERLPYY